MYDCNNLRPNNIVTNIKTDLSAYRELEASSFLSISLPSTNAKYFLNENWRIEIDTEIRHSNTKTSKKTN